ncbi:hypothetical protein N665_0042s0021 [Sinapis alba]|nr:hypothetical protein N665_0042s0021 [Sinapis alba]
MIDRHLNAEGVLCALIVSSSAQMQSTFDEHDANEDIQQMIKEVLLDTFPKVGYTVAAGRLFYKGRLVLPRNSQLIQHTLSEYHGGVIEVFYWPKMKEDVKKHMAEYSTLKHAGLLQPIELPTLIWSEILTDFIEEHPKSEGVNVILVVVERLSKYVHYLSLKHPFTATTAAEKFVKEIFNTAYHTHSDDQTEMVNCCLESNLSKTFQKLAAKYYGPFTILELEK